MKWGIIAGVLGGIAAAEAGGSVYFYRRTMMRYNAKKERTMKMSGVDWESYYSFMKPRGEWMRAHIHGNTPPTFLQASSSEYRLRLHATYFPGIDGGNPDKAVICFHGYTSEAMSDYSSISNYYLKKGYSMLLVDARAHGQSEGKFIGFGCKDRYDALKWIDWMIKKAGNGIRIVLMGTSHGG